jgi:hypothetical protein
MKFTKFIPLALMLAIAVSPALADPQGNRSLDDTFIIDVPEYFNISREGTATTSSGTVTVGTDMESLSWTNTMGVTYNVTNNKHRKTFYLKANCPVTGNPKAFATAFGDAEALPQAANTIKLAFANTSTTTSIPDQTAVNDALAAEPTPATNKNVIAATMTLAAVTPTNGGSVYSRTVTGQEIVYVIDEGSYQFGYTIGKTALGSTFSPHDEMGQYKATLTITDVATGS